MIRNSALACLRNTILLNASAEPTPMGGYFELELPQYGTNYHKSAYRYQSARAAFRAVLRLQRPNKVWMPKYICNSMLLPIEEENIEYGWYDLDHNLCIDNDFVLNEGEWLLYVNYFGICDQNIEAILARFPVQQLILDFSQAFFSQPSKRVLATIYSPRKFFGVPDGGLLVTDTSIILPEERDVDSINRMMHLLKRLNGMPEAGYKDYQIAEKTLDACYPRKMSELTERLLDAIDYIDIRKKRYENFMFLHERLKKTSLFNLDHSTIQSPLCYPYLTDNLSLRKKLIDNRIFLPTYWNDAIKRVGDDWADLMVQRLLPIPIDHRYGKSEMEYVVKLILECDE